MVPMGAIGRASGPESKAAAQGQPLLFESRTLALAMAAVRSAAATTMEASAAADAGCAPIAAAGDCTTAIDTH